MKFPFFSKKTKSPAPISQARATASIPERFTINPETGILEIGIEDLSLTWRTPENFSQICGAPETKS